MKNKKQKDFEILKDMVAIITGGATGIGRSIAATFAEQGAVVVIADKNSARGRKTAESLCKKGRKAVFMLTDLTEEGDIKKTVNATARDFGRLDIIINNARPKLKDQSLFATGAEWDIAMDVILKAPILIAKYACKKLEKAKRASIINLSSTNAFYVSQQPAVYHIAKAGLIQLTRYMAYEFGGKGIRVNAICPALVDVYDDNRKPLTDILENKTVVKSVVPLKRAAFAEEIADVAVFLCSDSAAYITGQTIIVDGGITAGDHFRVARDAYRIRNKGNL